MSDVSSEPGPELVSDQERTQSGGALALSSAQLGIWFAQKLNPSSSAYNIGEYIAIEGPIVLPLFERALRQVVAEAQSLRLQFSEQAGEPAQMVGEPTVQSVGDAILLVCALPPHRAGRIRHVAHRAPRCRGL